MTTNQKRSPITSLKWSEDGDDEIYGDFFPVYFYKSWMLKHLPVYGVNLQNVSIIPFILSAHSLGFE